MSVGRRLALAAQVASLLLASGAHAAPSSSGQAKADLFIFSQHDDGANPYKNEEMVYGGLRLARDSSLGDGYALDIEATLAYIVNPDDNPLPASIDSAVVTAVSADLWTLELITGLSIERKEWDWRLRIGTYYHHQPRYTSVGLDFKANGELVGGDALATVAYSLRVALPKPQYWDGREAGRQLAVANNFLVGWTHNLSPEVKAGLSLQYTRQNGWLHDAYNFVALFRGGLPVDLTDEELPHERNRGQLNLRLRWSPALGLALGLDVSGYLDDWGIEHLGLEPVVEIPFPEGIRLRLWYRFSVQSETRYFAHRPESARGYRTQDSDLGSFTMHTPGLLLVTPFGGDRLTWVGRWSVYGFYRDDGLYAIGGSVGVMWKW